MYVNTAGLIFIKILPEMCFWAMKLPLNFGSHPLLNPDLRILKGFFNTAR